MSWGANLDEKVDGLFGSIDRSGPRRSSPAGGVAAVPRPIRPREPGKIDLSTAPSSMEQLAKKWSGR